MKTANKRLLASAYWLVLLERQQANATRLLTLFNRWCADEAKDADTDAIWEGMCALNEECRRYVENIKQLGGLLFVGSKEAIKAAQRIEADMGVKP